MGADLTREPLVHRSRTEQKELLRPWQVELDVLEKSRKVLETSMLAGGLRRSPAAVANHRVVADMPGGTPMGRDIGAEALDLDGPRLPARDDGLSRIDPDEDQGVVVRDRVGHCSDRLAGP